MLDWLLRGYEAYGEWLRDAYALHAQDPYWNAFDLAFHSVIGALLLFHDYPALIPTSVAGAVWIMRDSVICFIWGRLRTDNWYLDNPYAAWIQLIQTSLEREPFLHRQSIIATSPRGLEDLVHKSRLKGRRKGSL